MFKLLFLTHTGTGQPPARSSSQGSSFRMLTSKTASKQKVPESKIAKVNHFVKKERTLSRLQASQSPRSPHSARMEDL